MKINREELAWAAGFFDGEGCVAARSYYKDRHYATLELGQVEKQPLERFQQAIVGLGRLYYAKAKQCRSGGYWRLTVCSYEDVQAIAAFLWAFLSEPKKKQFAAALLASKNTKYQKRGRRPKRVVSL